MPPRPPLHVARAAVKRAEEIGIAAAAREIGKSATTISTWKASMARWEQEGEGTQALPGAPDGVMVANVAEKVAGAADIPLATRDRLKLEDRIRSLESELKAIHREDLSIETVRREIMGLAQAPVDPPKWVIDTHAPASGPGTPILLVSDVHWNEVVRREEVNGINAYNPELQVSRLRRAAERTIDLCFNHVAKPKYPGIVVVLGGDIVSGDIHDELVETNAAESIPTALDAASNLIAFLRSLADKFSRVFVVTAYGNHGRQHRSYRFKRHAYQSYDWLTYQIIARHFQDTADDRVRFMIPDGPDALISVAGRRYLVTHGDNLGVRGGDGIIGALGPIRRGAVKVSAQYGSLGLHYDTIVMGHWHQLIMLDDIVVNGSAIGYNEYARNGRFTPEVPRFALWGSHPRQGISYRYTVNLDDPRAAIATGEWVEWNKGAS